MTTDLVQYNGRANLRTTETALELAPDLAFEEWAEIGSTLGRAHRASGWWIGDWINYGEARWGEKYDEAVRITGLAYDTLRRYSTVAAQISIRDRIPNLGFSHHVLVAPIEDHDERQAWLDRASRGGWSRAQLRKELAPLKASKISAQKRHTALIETADALIRIGERWERGMTDALTPPQAKKQLTVLRKAQDLLGEVIDAVEYRAATLHTWNGR